jgi:hypothetical protein
MQVPEENLAQPEQFVDAQGTASEENSTVAPYKPDQTTKS